MLGTLIGLIFFCILVGVVWWAINELLSLIPLGEPFRTVVRILMIVIAVILVVYIAQVLLGIAGVHVNTFHF